jgi:hypothetical protein
MTWQPACYFVAQEAVVGVNAYSIVGAFIMFALLLVRALVGETMLSLLMA